MVLEINSENFNKEVIEHNGVVVVDFYADWCGPCRKMSPILEEVDAEFSGKVKFVKINTDNNINIAKEYQISGLPSLMVFADGKATGRLVGLMPKSQIITNIEKYI